MPNAVRSVRAALACPEGEIPGEIPTGIPTETQGVCPRLTGVVPTGTAPFAVLDPGGFPRSVAGFRSEVG